MRPPDLQVLLDRIRGAAPDAHPDPINRRLVTLDQQGIGRLKRASAAGKVDRIVLTVLRERVQGRRNGLSYL